MQEGSDIALWEQVKAGDAKAFRELFLKYSEDLLSYGPKLTANEDLTKDTVQRLFMTLWDNRAKFIPPDNTKAYLMRSFRNNLLRELKKELSIRDVDVVELPLEEENEMSNSDRLLGLRSHIAQLPDRQREVIHLRYFQNVKNQEIAEIMEISYQSVGNLLQRALKALKVIMLSDSNSN